jgi:hypothetical protein
MRPNLNANAQFRRYDRNSLAIVTHFERRGEAEEAGFGSLEEAYEFLCREHADGDVEVFDISTGDGEVLITHTGFSEIFELDDGPRRGWFDALLSARAP